MALQIRKLHPVFAAEVLGLDIRESLSSAQIGALVQALDAHAVLLFRNQPMDEDQQIRFARQFGPLDLGLRKVNRTRVAHRFRHEEMIDISNVDINGQIADRNSRKMYSQLANQLWHSDSSFQQPAARYSMLHSVVNPSAGGQTEFADLRAAYDTLGEDLKALVAGLESEHYALHSRLSLGDAQYTEEEKQRLPAVRWPLVRTHPGSGRKLLWVGIHATQITGMHLGEGRLLLAELLEHATHPERVYRHQWQPGDLLMWDNRSTIHRGRRYDLNERRELRRTSTEDREDAPAREAATPAQAT
jgi:alpha-ketoglutarate-dependent 2,4-dichlorophenoxyacetate dioxygenase